MRLDSGWQRVIITMVSGGTELVPMELDKVRAGPPLAAVMKRRRSWGDSELLGSNTDDTTDTSSEQDEASSLRSSWSLVSHSDRSLTQPQLELQGNTLVLYCMFGC